VCYDSVAKMTITV